MYEPGQKLIQWINFPAIERHDAASKEKTMTRRPRRNQSPAFKAKVAVAAIKGEKTLIELAQDFDVRLLPAGVCLQTPRGEPDQAMA